ncbi:EamA family transporter [Magnetospirillum sp. UT-4]|uniref:EamA family transporter n=1 Tax=Magnetospirillum sp. UT-4 TaxID=2681467 RepID=UPI00157216B9|nr:EamA family transporter [Magnetospirillum sp. UT-4]
MTSVLLGLLAALGWGLADFAARFSGRALGSVAALAGVAVAGSAALTLWLLTAGDGLPLTSWPSPWALAYGGFGLAGMLGLYECLRRGPVTVVVPLVDTFPAWALALMVAFGGVRPGPAEWAAMAAVMAGVWLVARHAPEDRTSVRPSRSTIVLALASGAAFGAALNCGTLAAPVHGEVETVWIARSLAALVLVPVVVRRGEWRVPPRWAALVAVQGLLDTLGLLALLWAGAGEAAADATVVASTFGIITFLLARFILKEAVTPPQWLGVALSFGGVAVLAGLG